MATEQEIEMAKKVKQYAYWTEPFAMETTYYLQLNGDGIKINLGWVEKKSDNEFHWGRFNLTECGMLNVPDIIWNTKTTKGICTTFEAAKQKVEEAFYKG
jgi:hypothetical protein